MNSLNTDIHYSQIEVEEMLENMSEADIARVLQNYRTLGCEQRSGYTEDDLLQQAILQALSLERPWPRDVNTAGYLTNSGKSMLSNEHKKQSRQIIAPTISEVITKEEKGHEPTSATATLSHSSAETSLENNQSEQQIAEWIDKLQQLFIYDADASCFIEQKLANMKKSKILAICELTDQVYRNVEKRIKDKLRKRFPNGLPWWEIKS